MTREFGALLAQVIPVLLLALLLELRHILQASEAESAALRALGVRTRDQMLVENVRKRIARAIGVEIKQEVDERVPEGQDENKERIYYVNGLSKVDAFGFAAFIGLIMLVLTRAEVIALVAAAGSHVSEWERSAALFVALLSLTQLAVIPVGLEVYKLVGLKWSRLGWKLYWTAGGIAQAFIIISLLPYFDSMIGLDLQGAG